MPLNQNSTFEEVKKWLDENLSDLNSFTPHSDKIPEIRQKGIYFWFMHSLGYSALSKKIKISPINQRYSKETQSSVFDLIYLGSTGIGKKGHSNINKRLNFHINQQHKVLTIYQKYSALSTLRTGLGSLLSNDLIVGETERLVNDFMSKYIKVYWIEFPDNIELINSYQKTLIQNLKPLLNLKNNSNSHKGAKSNPTKEYQTRSARIENKTKLRLGY